MPDEERPQVRGPVVDEETRCVHYRGPSDVVAIKFRCCREFYPCIRCHEETADHEPEQWAIEEAAERAILCGVCGETMSIARYMLDGSCCACNAGFNPRCRLHYPYYFSFETPVKSA